MVITFVIDMIGATNNGTTVTAMRTAAVLREHGHTVRFIAFVPKDHSDLSQYDILSPVKINFGVFNPIIDENGMFLAKLTKDDYPKVKEFLKGSDLVHLMMPFKLEMQVRLIAKAMGIPVTSAMHVQPENVSYNIGMGHSHLVNAFIYFLFNGWMYHYTQNVHTPSEMMKKQMIAHNYKNDIFAISNGVSARFVPTPTPKPDDLKDKYVILMIGRLSGEKRQDLLIKAIGKSSYNAKIQLILCGQGPKKKCYQKLSDKYLANPVRFEFVTQDELLKIINYSDLYVHASDAESEAISCIEAFSCGKVPIISDSKVSATNHFALDPRCLFKAGKSESLRERIEYFIQHPEAKEEISKKYVAYGKTFALDGCVKKLEAMFEKAITDDQEDKRQHRAYRTSLRERHRLKVAARKAGIENPVIF